MNGYLVVISGTFHDFAVRLCESESFAREFAASCDPQEQVTAVAQYRDDITSTSPFLVRVQKFVDGAAVSDEIIRDLCDEGGAS